ncbi:MAG TPA: DUF4870 domain-containing protein, partial [Candidatus Thermoplasmatota archaeon]|nr:DUF4870 domain-containing protein [Candidatus Thermoplasmatota archaeon]
MTETKTAKSSPNPTANPSETTMACVAYILTWVTGLIVLLTAQKTEKFKRWHAIQAIGLGIAFTVLSLLLQLVLAPLVFTSGSMVLLGSMLSLAVFVGTLILVILCAVKAYQGGFLRLPVIADIADKNA